MRQEACIICQVNLSNSSFGSFIRNVIAEMVVKLLKVADLFKILMGPDLKHLLPRLGGNNGKAANKIFISPLSNCNTRQFIFAHPLPQAHIGLAIRLHRSVKLRSRWVLA